MTDLRKAAEEAATDLEELIHWHGVRDSNDKLMPAHNQTPEIKSAMETLEALRQALEQPEQEEMLKQGWRQCAIGQRTTQYCSMAEQARLEEREACAKVCDGWTNADGDRCAEAIRARGET